MCFNFLYDIVPARSATACQPPYEKTAVGCIYLHKSLTTYCSGKRLCLEGGAELMSPDSHADVNALRSYMESTYGTSENLEKYSF